MLNSSRIKILVKAKWYSIKLLKSPQKFLALAFNEWSCTGLWKIYAMLINMLWNPEAQCRCPSKKGHKKYIVYERVGKEALFIQGHWIFSFRTFAEKLFIGKSATEGSRKKCESTNWKWLKHQHIALFRVMKRSYRGSYREWERATACCLQQALRRRNTHDAT